MKINSRKVRSLVMAVVATGMFVSSTASATLPVCAPEVDEACKTAALSAVLTIWFMPWAWGDTYERVYEDCKASNNCTLLDVSDTFSGG